MSYSFRIRLDTSKRSYVSIDAHELELAREGEIVIRLRGEKGTPLNKSNRLVVLGSGYETTEQALEAGRVCQDWLMIGLAKLRCGVDFGERAAGGFVVSSFLKAMSEQLNGPAYNDVHGLMVFPSKDASVFVRVGTPTLRMGHGEKSFTTVMQKAATASISLTNRERLAIALFNASYFQDYADTRFLLLVMSVEALAESMPRSAEAVQLVNQFIELTKASALSQAESGSILGSLKWLQSESIRQACRRVVATRLGDGQYGEKNAERFFADCYDLRSRLVHGVTPVPTRDAVGQAAAELEVLVSDLLTSAYFPIGQSQ